MKNGKKIRNELKRSRQELEKKIVKRTADLFKANKSLKTSEKKYSTLVEKSNDGIVIIQDGLLKFVNPAVTKFTGFSKDEAINKPFINFVSPKYKGLVIERYKKRLAGEKVPNKYEIEIISKNGKNVSVEVNASIITHEGKWADMAILRETTERKETEKILEEERKKMEAIYNTASEGLALYDAEGRVIDFNPSLRKLFGLKKEIKNVKRKEIAGNREQYFKYLLERFDDSLKTQKEVYSGKTVSNVLMKIHSNPPKYLEGTYVPIINDKKVQGMLASFRDVTTLKNQAEEIAQQLIEVEKQRNRWEAVFENVEEGVFVIDGDNMLSRMNGSCELMTGFEEREVVGKPYYQIFGCHDTQGNKFPEFHPIDKVYKTNSAIPYDEHLHRNQEGNEIWVGVSYTPILSDNGVIEQVVGVIRDITAIKQTEKAKSEFVSVASHELRTPLTVIHGYLSLLLNGDLGDMRSDISRINYINALNKIYGETKRLTKLVEELLNISRIEERRLKLYTRKSILAIAIDEVISEFKPLAESKGLHLEFICDKKLDGTYVLIDRDKFKQVLVNLLDNAIKYTEKGNVTIKSIAKNGEILTQVSDTGTGIPTGLKNKVFEKFQQVGVSYLKENKGTGLGLYIVKAIVELHKGRIWCDSQINIGTTFTFTLPIVA